MAVPGFGFVSVGLVLFRCFVLVEVGLYGGIVLFVGMIMRTRADLGATPVQAFLRVTLPLSLPGVISGITLVFLPAVSSFFIPKLLGGGQFVLVGNIIESQFLTSGDWNFGSAISLIMAIIIMLSMWLTRKVDVQPASRGKE